LSIIIKGSKRDSDSGNESTSSATEYEFIVQVDESSAQSTARVNQRELYVLENWHRIYDAMLAKPPDERESFKYQEGGSSTANGNGHYGKHGTNGADSSSTESGRHRHGHHGHTATDDNDFSSTASDSEKSDTSSPYGSSENIPNSIEQIEHSKVEINEELRTVWSLDENERKKRINKLLLKWHPDKNPGQEKFAAEVFKHLKKQIELFKTDPFLAGLYRSSYSPYTSSGFSSSSAYGTGASGTTGGTASDDFKSRHYGSFDDLHRKGGGGASPTGGSSPHASPSREGSAHGGASSGAYDAYDKMGGGPGASNLGRAGSFRQEWERRRQQKRQATGTDPSKTYTFRLVILDLSNLNMRIINVHFV
jgi:hypothetical protein